MGAAFTTQARGAAESPREAASSARLALAEFLLASDDPGECAQAAVDWLIERAGAKKVLCALIDAESGTVEHVAASGVPEGAVASVHLALEETDHPLVFALASREPVTLSNGSRRNGD